MKMQKALTQCVASALSASIALSPLVSYATTLTDEPLATINTVRPNLMFILDNSGSMEWGSMTGYDATAQAGNSLRAYYSSAYNGVYYNPATTYTPASNYDGTSMGDSNPTAAVNNPYLSGYGTRNLTATCFAQSTPILPFYGTPPSNSSSTTNCKSSSTLPNHTNEVNRYAFYYVWDGTTDIAMSNPPNSAFPTRVDIRSTTATYPKAATRTDCGAGPTCTYAQEIQNFANWWTYYRSRILMTKTALGNVFGNVDPVTSPAVPPKFRVGFSTINDNNGNVGNANGHNFINIGDFDSAKKSAFYTQLYSIDPGGGTPLQKALERAGNYYRNGSMGYSGGPASVDPIQYSCQQNFSILSTDGYWNSNTGSSGTTIGNHDRTVPTLPTDPATGSPAVIPGLTAGSNWPAPFFEGPGIRSDSGTKANTVADVAMYYWANDLRTSGSFALNNVPTDAADPAMWQHMTTYTIGLGASGTAPYDPEYLTNPGPFYLSVLGDANGNGTIDAGETTPGGWPIPDSDNDGAGDEDPATAPRTIDDLWHAAVNGHGQYFSAKDPTSLAIGMTSIVNDIIGRVSSGAGAGVAAPVITTTNNGVYTVTYKGGEWSGQVNKQTIDPNTGAVSSTPVWQARDQLNTLASSGGWDTNRKIATLKSDGTKIPFRWANLSSTQQSTFGSTAGGQQQVVNWLRGDKSLEGVGAGKYRIRTHILGDIAGSEAVVVGKPTEKFNEIDNPGYSSFKSTQASRTEMVYVGANDGMLHAFDATTGAERWAYVPGILIRPGADGLAALSYQQGGTPPFNHHYYVDQTPQVQDIDFNKTFGASGAPDWHTILVGGLNKGGKGFYALDITNPSASDETDVANKILWEFTDPTTPDDMGYSFGRPLVAKTAAHGWVVIVSSGHNNVSGGGFVYVLNARTGALLHKLSTGQGTSANPSGLARTNGYQINDTDGTIQHIYGGDLFGNVWRWDVSSPSTSSWTRTLLATLTDSGGTPQPITTSPRLALDVRAAVPTRWVFVGTGKYLGIPDNTTTQTQTMYAIKDGGKTVPSDPPSPITRSNMTAITGVGSGTPITTQGWYYDLTAGERINVDPVPNQGIIAWVTTIPSTDPCSPGFSGRAYARKYATGESILVDGSGNLVASVFNQKGYLDVKFLMVNGKIKLYVVKPPDSATGIPPLEPLPTDPSAFGAGVGRVNWREILD